MVLAVQEAPRPDLEELLAAAWSAKKGPVSAPSNPLVEVKPAADSEKTSRTEGEVR